MENTRLLLNNGGIIIFPTDTAFGIGCRIDRPAAVDRLFKIRKRPMTQATPVLVDSIHMALTYLSSPSYIVRHLMKEYWPGALTVVTPCKKNLVYSPIRGNGKNIGVRMPDHETARELIGGVGVPILGPSANFHGLPTPFQFKDLDPELVKLVDYVVPGECKIRRISTVVDCSVEPYRIIRQGAVKLITLFLNTSKSDEVFVALEIGGVRFEKQANRKPALAQMVLPLIEDVLKEQKLSLSDISEITVHTGPGSFTGLRVGIAVGQMLGVMLNIPVNGRLPGTSEVPQYSSSRFD